MARRFSLSEDDEQVREVVVELLDALGYRPLSAGNGAEGVALLQSQAPVDLLITDIVLPGGMDGRRLATLAKESWPHIRVLYMSGYSENAIIHDGRLDRDVVLLSKPFRRVDVALKVRQVLRDEASA